jgi:hypothetical protein
MRTGVCFGGGGGGFTVQNPFRVKFCGLAGGATGVVGGRITVCVFGAYGLAGVSMPGVTVPGVGTFIYGVYGPGTFVCANATEAALKTASWIHFLSTPAT